MLIFILNVRSLLKGLITGKMLGRLLQEEFVAAAGMLPFPIAFRMTSTMSGRLYVVNESVPCFLETGLLVTGNVEIVFVFPFCLEVV